MDILLHTDVNLLMTDKSQMHCYLQPYDHLAFWLHNQQQKYDINKQTMSISKGLQQKLASCGVYMWLVMSNESVWLEKEHRLLPSITQYNVKLWCHLSLQNYRLNTQWLNDHHRLLLNRRLVDTRGEWWWYLIRWMAMSQVHCTYVTFPYIKRFCYF